jgi:hypothetical protein
MLATQTQAHVILGQHHAMDARVYVGFVLGEPEKLGCREACQGTIATQLDQAVSPDSSLDLLTLPLRATVVPKDGGSQRAVVAPEHDQAVHLAGETDPIARERA